MNIRTDPIKNRLHVSRRTPLILLFIGFGVLICLIGLAGVLTYHMMTRPGEPSLKKVADPIPKNFSVLKPIPPFEIYPEPDSDLKPARPQPKLDAPATHPRVAIVIDDIGYDRNITNRFLSLGVDFSFSLLPHSPFQKEIAESLFEKGADVMLHLPLEPHEDATIHLGMDVLLISMGPDAFVSRLIENLEAVPHIKGVNNHMGSKMTENAGLMRSIFSVMKARDLFFLDSLTTHKSICKIVADQVGIRFVQRDVFLDHVPKRQFILSQIDALIALAHTHGYAIGIAHPYEITFQTLRDTLPELIQKIDLVPISAIVAAANPPPGPAMR